MKKTLSILLTTLLMLSLFPISAFAADLKDGTYKVPLSMVKYDSDEESLAASFLESYCYVEVNGNEKTLYIPLREEIESMGQVMDDSQKSQVEVSYYVDGVVDKQNGKVEKAEKLTNVTVGSEKHSYLFKMPMVIKNDIGLKFKAPGMPSFVNPSAVARLNLSKAKSCDKIVYEEVTTTTTTPAETTTVANSEVTTTNSNAATTENKESSSKNTPIIIGVAVVAVIAIVVIAIVIKKKKDNEYFAYIQQKATENSKNESNENKD